MNKRLQVLSLLTAMTAFAACKSAPPPLVPPGEPVYTRVGMHFDDQRGKMLMYTTNYVDMPHYVPPGTALTLQDVGRRAIELSDDQGNEYVIRYVKKHSGPFEEWIEANFSAAPVEMPGSLSEDERDAILQGEVREGMSREAVLLAWGYPPQTLNRDTGSGPLNYDGRRFGASRRTIRFDAEDRVESITR